MNGKGMGTLITATTGLCLSHRLPSFARASSDQAPQGVLTLTLSIPMERESGLFRSSSTPAGSSGFRLLGFDRPVGDETPRDDGDPPAMGAGGQSG
jgi:hypothetical protein